MLVVVHVMGDTTHVAFPPGTVTPFESTQTDVWHLSGGLQITFCAAFTWQPKDGVVHELGLHTSVVTQDAGHEHANDEDPEHEQKPPQEHRVEVSGHRRRYRNVLSDGSITSNGHDVIWFVLPFTMLANSCAFVVDVALPTASTKTVTCSKLYRSHTDCHVVVPGVSAPCAITTRRRGGEFGGGAAQLAAIPPHQYCTRVALIILAKSIEPPTAGFCVK